jgi:hypothetical protein
MSTRGAFVFSLLLCLVFFTAVTANADEFTFTLGPATIISFTLPGIVTQGTVPPPNLSVFSGPPTGFNGFQIGTTSPGFVSMQVNGVQQMENIAFSTSALGGGLAIGALDGTTPDLFNEIGPQLFNLNNLSPFSATFKTGTFPLSFSNCPIVGGVNQCGTPTTMDDLTLTITPGAAAVPEPSTILLLGGGLAAAIGAMRRKLHLL